MPFDSGAHANEQPRLTLDEFVAIFGERLRQFR